MPAMAAEAEHVHVPVDRVELHGAHIAATSGLALGGQKCDGSVDGNPVGAPVTETLAQDGHAQVVRLPASDAVVVPLWSREHGWPADADPQRYRSSGVTPDSVS